ncbi:alkaline phosphatase family protein [Phyllobacterium zundukense]|uniref:Nucleotide pyrophosphatase n=1 Tax=Phyllobacterium zundukense TaxID=1867719 RepID=A0A2N9VYQ1_9HYPH|nr:alkaline phosphatase family protein [Phyllobacterium zundukense]ATU95204.1 nucleotide pyrophosphatase [Phyllobacterium zundukense]PIO44619.1 nucleotide pyrophosphatase [Phyllobacterium zundukense]
MRRVVAVILDGLRRDFVREDTTPNLLQLRESSEWFAAHRSVTPSVTRVCSSSFTTGCSPAQHGLEGNSLALLEQDRFVIHDAGHPDFLQHRRHVVGTSLDRPGLAELLKERDGTIVYSNVSPGAAYAHDPDGNGYVYHRAGSFGPERKPEPAAQALQIDTGLAGDRALTERFIADALTARQPAFALLWLGHPDTTQHDVPLGSPEHIAALNEADRHAGMVIDQVDRLRKTGDDILLLVGSDHGHQTVRAVIDVSAEIASLGFGDPVAKGDLIVVPNGTAVLIYATEEGRKIVPSLVDRLSRQPWAGEMFAGEDLGKIGQTSTRGLALFLSMASDEQVNEFGVPGRSYAARPLSGKSDRLGRGQHGGLGAYEQSPVLMIGGPGFSASAEREETTSILDIAPTILRHLGIAASSMQCRALQRA